MGQHLSQLLCFLQNPLQHTYPHTPNRSKFHTVFFKYCLPRQAGCWINAAQHQLLEHIAPSGINQRQLPPPPGGTWGRVGAAAAIITWTPSSKYDQCNPFPQGRQDPGMLWPVTPLARLSRQQCTAPPPSIPIRSHLIRALRPCLLIPTSEPFAATHGTVSQAGSTAWPGPWPCPVLATPPLFLLGRHCLPSQMAPPRVAGGGWGGERRGQQTS